MMRISLLCAALIALSACATAPAPAPAPAPAVEPVDTGPSPAALALAAFLRGAGGANAPTQAAVERALGRADVAREDGAGAALTYRLESCALMLLFSADGQNAKRLAETYPGPRRAGAAAPDLETCASEALARGARGVS